MSEENFVHICPFCGHALETNTYPKGVENVYFCPRCEYEFIDNFRLKRKGEKIYLEREGYIWI